MKTGIRKLRKILVLAAVYLTVQAGSILEAAAQTPQPASNTQSSAKRPPIVSRKQWNAKDPVGKAAKHKPRFITIHHTGMPQKPELSLEQKMRGLQNFSQNEGKLASGKSKPAWFDVPYHYYIASDGRIAEGRKINTSATQTPNTIRRATLLLCWKARLEKSIQRLVRSNR